LLTVAPKDKDKIRGRKVHLHLTKLSKEAYEIGLLPSWIPDRYFLMVEEKEEEEKERTVFKDSFAMEIEERERLELATKKAACLLLLLVQGASGTLYLSPVTDREAEPGDIIIANKPFYSYKKRGFSIKDLVEHKDIGHAWMFDHVSFTESEIEKLVKYLMEEHDPPALIKVEQEGEEGGGGEETRYEITDQSLAEIVGCCGHMLFAAQERTLYKWRYIEGPYPETGELNWYGLVFGRIKALDLFEEVKKTRQSQKEEEKTTTDAAASIEHAKKDIEAFDESIDKLYKEIMDPKYSDIRNTYYPALVKGLLELAYPQFSRKNIKELQKPKQQKK
jgi:hypothetical protein